MKQQVIFIHWWVSKDNYIDFSEYLEKFIYEPFKVKPKKWKMTLKEDLGNEFEVFMPDMPNKDFADYNEWKIMFEKVLPFLDNNVILIWHSLGWTFLCKYLEENKFSNEIKEILIVAWAFEDDEIEVLWNFNFNINTLKKYEDKISFYHSKDDFVVNFSDLEKFKDKLPNADYKIFENKWHFIEETFRELIKDIKKIVK